MSFRVVILMVADHIVTSIRSSPPCSLCAMMSGLEVDPSSACTLTSIRGSRAALVSHLASQRTILLWRRVRGTVRELVAYGHVRRWSPYASISLSQFGRVQYPVPCCVLWNGIPQKYWNQMRNAPAGMCEYRVGDGVHLIHSLARGKACARLCARILGGNSIRFASRCLCTIRNSER